jgi:hypothetical protein
VDIDLQRSGFTVVQPKRNKDDIWVGETIDMFHPINELYVPTGSQDQANDLPFVIRTKG